MADVPVLHAVGLSKSFEHKGHVLDVLRGVDLKVMRGEIVGIVGESGAGKSTLLHCLGTLDNPTGGSLHIDGIDATSMGSDALAQLRNSKIGFVFQSHHLLPEFTALENVMMPGLISAKPRAALEAKATSLLELVGLGARKDHRPSELSGGEQQRVSLARALILDPALVMADEPSGNLDSKTAAQIHELFFKLNETKGATFVIVTHNNEFAAQLPRVVTMRDGSVLSDQRNAPPDSLHNG